MLVILQLEHQQVVVVIVVACLLQVCLEGQISRDSALQCLHKGRLPSGDQIPWKFCEEFEDTGFPSLSSVRVVRIAVHPSALAVLRNFCDSPPFSRFIVLFKGSLWFCCFPTIYLWLLFFMLGSMVMAQLLWIS